VEAVRRAGAADLDRCRELLADAIEAVQGHRGAALLLADAASETGPAGSLVERWNLDPETELLVGTFSDAVVGIAAGTLSQLGERRVGRIECFYVEPDARAVGVGQAMVGSLVEWFATQGCTDVDAVALPGDRSSKQLLESSGFKARLLVLHRSLG
jgi:GNAT superfamily N-acetyltransferase